MITAETQLKARILTQGVSFTEQALRAAERTNAKRQNLVYNQPFGSEKDRPQELMLCAKDGYSTVVSCVAPVLDRHVLIDCDLSGMLIASIDGKTQDGLDISYVSVPEYYKKQIPNGHPVTDYVSACGLDELNIIPWKGCAISKPCLFCGANVTAGDSHSNISTAFEICGNNGGWNQNEYINNLKKAVQIAKNDKCYSEHMHVIIISGNLRDDELNRQCKIYADISRAINEELPDEMAEGIIVVTMPPSDVRLLHEFKSGGVSKVIFNLEVGNEPWFSKYCPGKSSIGYENMINALKESVEIFGIGNVWTNFVLGLEPIDKLLSVCENLAKQGIASSANVLHLDKGHRLDCDVPDFETVTHFFYNLSNIYRKYNMTPLYCAKALRTSLSNEAYDGRICL